MAVAERFLLIDNKAFFDKMGIYTINHKNDIPSKSAILFIGSHTKSINNLNNIQIYFEHIEKKSQYNYIIIVGKGDGILDKGLHIPTNILGIYATNTNYNHSIIKFLPMGSDFRSISSFGKADFNNNKRDILCYCNFSLDTHKDRTLIFNIVKNKSFVTIENMGTFLKYSISRNDFFKRLGESKFTICPRGNALDTFRFYDALYAGSIPIVIREAFHSSAFLNDLPILFLDKIEDFHLLTEERLEKVYLELLVKKPNVSKLDFGRFINKLKTLT